ncbi:hypothetical protein ACTFIU_002420 [Dictyostelium citrinum]
MFKSQYLNYKLILLKPQPVNRMKKLLNATTSSHVDLDYFAYVVKPNPFHPLPPLLLKLFYHHINPPLNQPQPLRLPTKMKQSTNWKFTTTIINNIIFYLTNADEIEVQSYLMKLTANTTTINLKSFNY